MQRKQIENDQPHNLYVINEPQPTLPHTEATYESTRIAAMMDLDLPIACGNLDAKEKEGNKKRMTNHKSYHRKAI